MDSIKDLLGKKADDIDTEGRRGDVELAQTVFDRHFSGEAKVSGIKENSLTVQVSSSPLASEVRLMQISLIEELNRLLKQPVARLVIRQGNL